VTAPAPASLLGRWAHVERRHLVLAAGGCVGLAVVGLVDPSRHTVTPPCPLRTMTGLDCPLCGATRATHALLQGHLVKALDFNALYVLALPIVAVLAAWWLLRGHLPAFTERPAVRWTVIAVAVLFAVARNLPAFSVLGS
jgi:hypothetical protein